MRTNLAEARAGLYPPTDPRITQEVLFDAVSEAYYRVMTEGMRPRADFSLKASRASLDVMTEAFWRPEVHGKPFQAALRSAIHIPDPEYNICVLVGSQESMQGIPINPLSEIHNRDLQLLRAEQPTAETERKVRETAWTIELLKHNSTESILTEDTDEWKKLQELLAYRIYELHPNEDKGSTYEKDKAISIALMRSPVFAFRDREWREKIRPADSQS